MAVSFLRMIYTSYHLCSATLLLHAKQVLGGGGVLIFVLGSTPLLLSLHHPEVPLRELLREAASEDNSKGISHSDILFAHKLTHTYSSKLDRAIPDDRVGVCAAAAGALGEDGLAGGADDVSLLALVDGRARDLHADGALQLLLQLLQLGVAHGRVLSAGFTYLR